MKVFAPREETPGRRIKMPWPFVEEERGEIKEKMFRRRKIIKLGKGGARMNNI